MQLTQEQRCRLTSQLDEEDAVIRDMLDCDEYRLVLLETVRRQIHNCQKLMRFPGMSPASEVTMNANIVDLMNVLRIAYSHLCREILGGE